MRLLLLVLYGACSSESKLAHVLQNRTQLFPPKNHSSRFRRLTRAEQTVEANEWWCSSSERHNSLRCRRHQLQRRHQQATDLTTRDLAAQELRQLLASAPSAALAAMQQETEAMLRGWCALATSAGLDLCVVASGGTVTRARHGKSRRRRSKKTGKAKALLAGASSDLSSSSSGGSSGSGSSSSSGSGGGSGGGGSSSSGGKDLSARKKKKKRGIAVLWSADVLSLLRAWWCADRRHMREPRCSRGVRWTRQQPGLSAMRRMFCAQPQHRNSTSGGIMRLCRRRKGFVEGGLPDGAGGSGSAGGSGAYELSSGGRAGVGGGGTRLRRALRASTVLKLMLALLGCALLAGWKMRHWRLTWTPYGRVRPSSATQTGGPWDGFSAGGGGSVVESEGSAARRRHTPKRPRLQAV